MEQLNIEFTQASPGVDEAVLKKMAPVSTSDLPLYLARKKAESLLDQNKQGITIGCDQMVMLGKNPLGKPGTKDKAVEQLRLMQGKSHSLVTGLAVHFKGQWETHINRTSMKMKPLSEAQIKKYVDLENPIDCAGSYKVESIGLALFEEIKTDDHTAIVGLPMMALCQILAKFGAPVI